MFLKLLLISAVFLLTAFAGFAIRILLIPKGRFPETHISRNNEMKKRGITCAQNTDTGCTLPDGYPGCSVCNGTMP